MSMVNTAPGKISVRNLNFYYGKFHALKNINLDITKNQVTAFIGPSGCGKSTLLRTFNKMFELYPEQRAEGEILLDGDNILTNTQDIALLRAKVGMVFQKPTPDSYTQVRPREFELGTRGSSRVDLQVDGSGEFRLGGYV